MIGEAILEASRDDQGEALVRIGPTLDALMIMAAITISASEEVEAAESVHAFRRRLSVKFARQIETAKAKRLFEQVFVTKRPS